MGRVKERLLEEIEVDDSNPQVWFESDPEINEFEELMKLDGEFRNNISESQIEMHPISKDELLKLLEDG